MGRDLSASTSIDEPRGTIELPFTVRVLTSPVSPLQVFGGMYGTLLEVLGSTSIVIVLVKFFLVRREDLRDRFIHLIGKSQVTLTTQTIEDAGARVTGVSAVAVLVAAFFWMWLWGPVGLLLATPLTVCILVVGKHVPELSFLDILLGSEPVFEPDERIPCCSHACSTTMQTSP